jgi:hypothetical protein
VSRSVAEVSNLHTMTVSIVLLPYQVTGFGGKAHGCEAHNYLEGGSTQQNRVWPASKIAILLKIPLPLVTKKVVALPSLD